MHIDPAEQGLNAGDQLCRAERFAYMVIRSYRKGIDFVLLLNLRGQKNNPQPFIGLSDASAYLKSVDPRHHYIQQCDINIGHRCQLVKRLVPVCGLQHLKPVALQVNHNKTPDGFFILQDQYFTHRFPSSQ
ncbi:hypothetical protein D3C75_1072870 [compost metagenome]